MNATMSKQEAYQARREDYIVSVLDKISLHLTEEWAYVPSSKSGKYFVSIKNGKAYDCGCYDCHHDIGARHYCKHREAVDRLLARQQVQPEQVETTQQEVTSVAVPAYDPVLGPQGTYGVCPGCGCTYGVDKGDRCHIGFCFWNSWYTERKRFEEDERKKAQAKLQACRVNNKFSWSAA